MYCPKCGTYNEDAYRFCLSCGTRLEVHPLETLDRKTSDGRYIIDPKDWNVPSVVDEPVVAVSIQCEIDRQSEDADKSFEHPDASAVEVLSEIEPAEDGHQRDNPVEDDVIVLRKAEPRMSASTAKRISSPEEAAQ